jgi:hypothetical protein
LELVDEIADQLIPLSINHTPKNSQFGDIAGSNGHGKQPVCDNCANDNDQLRCA